jgi:hypothetical protein
MSKRWKLIQRESIRRALRNEDLEQREEDTDKAFAKLIERVKAEEAARETAPPTTDNH